MSLTPNPSKLYFKNLHGFRFFAAALVILSHIELFKKRAGLANLWDTPFFFEAGSAGVDFFFVLSGFLITSLLLKEMDETGKVDLKKFYLRRVLRIWPLYYLVLLLCYFVIPEIQFSISKVTPREYLKISGKNSGFLSSSSRMLHYMF